MSSNMQVNTCRLELVYMLEYLVTATVKPGKPEHPRRHKMCSNNQRYSNFPGSKNEVLLYFLVILNYK